MKKLNIRTIQAFTLVELIVVITILAILGTIAFISLQGYSRDSRDGARIADVNSVQKSLELYITEKGTYPIPDFSANIMYSGAIAWIEGTVGDTVIRNLDKVNKKPLDPLTGNEYTYSVTSGKTEYQLGAIKEGGLIGYELPLNQTYAANTKKALAMIRGTYNERFLRVQSGTLNWILAMPTIITADIRELDLQGQLNNKLLVYGNYGNLPHSYNNLGFAMTGGFDYTNTNPLVYSGSMKSLLEDDNKLIFIDALKEVYNGTIIQGEPNYQDIVNTNTGTNQTGAIYLVNNLINTDVGGINPGNVILSIGTTLVGDLGGGETGPTTIFGPTNWTASSWDGGLQRSLNTGLNGDKPGWYYGYPTGVGRIEPIGTWANGYRPTKVTFDIGLGYNFMTYPMMISVVDLNNTPLGGYYLENYSAGFLQIEVPLTWGTSDLGYIELNNDPRQTFYITNIVFE